MPGTNTPAQMFDHTVIELSGRSLTYPLDFAGPVSDAETIPVYQGGICSLNDAGEFVVGLGALDNEAQADGKTIMGLIAIQGSEEYDVLSDVGNFSGGVQSALVASGGYEIETTEFVAANYVPNEALTFGVDANRGLITKAGANYSDVNVIGVVSRSEKANEYNKSVLGFWSVFCPPIKSAVYALATP